MWGVTTSEPLIQLLHHLPTLHPHNRFSTNFLLEEEEREFLAFQKMPVEAVGAVLLQTDLEVTVMMVSDVAETYLSQMEHSVRVAVVRRPVEVMPRILMRGPVVTDVKATLRASQILIFTAVVVVVVVILYVVVVMLHWVAEATGGQVLTASMGLMEPAAVVVVLARLA